MEIYSYCIGPSPYRHKPKKNIKRQLCVAAVILAALAVTVRCYGQRQLMPAEKYELLRSYIPKIEDNKNISAKLQQATLFTDVEMPRIYQFQPILGGTGAPYTVFYSRHVRLNNIDPFTNGNMEFPWAEAGGMHPVDKSKFSKFKLLWLPPKPSGGVWPIVVFRGPMDKSDSVNMPIPMQAWRWEWPADTIVGEVLMKKFPDGTFSTFEMRLRLRELEDWDVEVYRPYPTIDSLVARLREIDQSHPAIEQLAKVPLRVSTLEDRNHTRKAFSVTSAMMTLPPLPGKELLDTIFKPSGGLTFKSESGMDCYAPTAADGDDSNIVPAGYLGSFLGTDRKSCMNCHRDTMRHVDRFQNRDWYGSIGPGPGGLLGTHPIDPSSVGPPSKEVRLRREFVEAGMVEMYDAAKHPADVYMIAPAFENLPRALNTYPKSGSITVGGP